ncbi:MAG: hypothetical protein Q7T18_01605, partial [Sedimentisphaerales bacterium]|nr:hypothetical protein [Sedimentisphaerales bacterium]
ASHYWLIVHPYTKRYFLIKKDCLARYCKQSYGRHILRSQGANFGMFSGHVIRLILTEQDDAAYIERHLL